MKGELAAGTYEFHSRKQWAEFRAEYEERVLLKKKPSTREAYGASMDHFERIAQPKTIVAIKNNTIEDYIASG